MERKGSRVKGTLDEGGSSVLLELTMPAQIKREVKLEIVHVLFLDIVGYSKRLTDEQQALSRGYNSTPTIVVQGPKGQAQPIVGAVSYKSLESTIKSVS